MQEVQAITAEVVAEDPEISLSGPASVIGKAVIVHAGRDDFESQPSGDAGARVGCGVIRLASSSDSAAPAREAGEDTRAESGDT